MHLTDDLAVLKTARDWNSQIDQDQDR